MNSRCFFIFSVIFCLIAGCGPKQLALSSALTNYHAGSLHLSNKQTTPLRIFVDALGAPHLEEYLSSLLKNSRFKIVDAPSKAGYILHVIIIKEGNVSLPALESAVKAGYGEKAVFSGHGVYGLVADALLVARKIPQAKRPSHQKLKAISSRNAFASAKMRLAVAGNGKEKHEAYLRALAEELAIRIKE